MKQILGLDLGVGSVGWAVIRQSDNTPEEISIEGLGSRVVPLNSDETTGFTKGNGESKCHERTLKRSMRRNLDRFQQRRKMLGQLLDELGMTFDSDLLRLSPLELWQLRADAADGKPVSAAQLGRVIYHINMRRGYKSSKDEESAEGADKRKQSEYLAKISGRAREAAEANQTPGQYFAVRLKESAYTTPSGATCCSYRIKEQTFPRHAYIEELRRILNAQRQHLPDILTDANIARIVDTIFYQRPLRSCKHLVSLCEFESHEITDSKGNKLIVGPRVAPASSPLAQECRIWEAVNNLSLINHHNRKRKDSPLPSLFDISSDARKLAYEYPIDDNDRRMIVGFLNENEKMKGSDLLKLLRLRKDDGFAVPAQVSRGLKGNVTRNMLRKALGDTPGADDLLRFDIEIVETDQYDEVTGAAKTMVSDSYLREPLYQLWHTCYSVSDFDEFDKAIRKKFGITDSEVINRLFHLDFRGMGYASKSAKMMTRIIPWLQSGYKYSEACELAGYKHSSYVTADENATRPLLQQLPPIQNGDLRQPVVEKILNQMVNVVNAAIDKYGPMDEIHVEMARELRRGKDQRKADYEHNSRREKDNDRIMKVLVEKGLKGSRTQIQKYRMLEESDFCCMYCGKPINDMEFLRGIEADREHVIPRSLFFDDSFSNKVCACRQCNAAKGQMTAYDFMAAQGDDTLTTFINRVNMLLDRYKKSGGREGISKTKHTRLLTALKDIPKDFIDRDLRLTQYITRKALDMLHAVSRNVMATSGSVTDFFRHAWGYDEILHSLNFARYDLAGQTDQTEVIHKGQTHLETRIAGWNKRLDHRHHAIDALTIALTRQAYVHRLNSLNASGGDSADGQSDSDQLTGNLNKWATSRPHPSVAAASDAVADIAISFKAGKKVTVPGKRYTYKGSKRTLAQDGLLVPRGALTKESTYGVRKMPIGLQPLKYLFNNPSEIDDIRILRAVEARLADNANDASKALKSCKRRPLTVEGSDVPVTEALCLKPTVVIRVKLTSVTPKNCSDIVDGAVREAVATRYEEVGGSADKFVKSLAERPLYRDAGGRLPITSVRIRKGLSPESITPVRYDSHGNAIGYAEFGNNHHIALYEKPDGTIEECVVPFAEAVRSRQANLPVVVTDPQALWQQIDMLDKELPESSLSRFPSHDSRFLMSMQVNEMFILGLSDEEFSDLVRDENRHELTSHLYRVQKLSSLYYDFKLHTSTLSDCTTDQMNCGNNIRIVSFSALKKYNPIKVRVDILGNIILPS